MKKLVLLSLTFLLFFASCSKTDSTSKPTSKVGTNCEKTATLSCDLDKSTILLCQKDKTWIEYKKCNTSFGYYCIENGKDTYCGNSSSTNNDKDSNIQDEDSPQTNVDKNNDFENNDSDIQNDNSQNEETEINDNDEIEDNFDSNTNISDNDNVSDENIETNEDDIDNFTENEEAIQNDSDLESPDFDTDTLPLSKTFPLKGLILHHGEKLELLKSTLFMQEDGNLVLYNDKNVALWATQTVCTKLPCENLFIFQDDGNLVVYQTTSTTKLIPLWDSKTGSIGVDHLVIDNEKLALYDKNGKLIWSSVD